MPCFPHKQRVFSPSPVLSRLIPSFSNTLSPYTDFLLNTVTGIHELHYLEEYPFSLENFQLSDYFTLSVHYADTTGEAHYEDTSNYLIVETESAWYLIEIGPNSVIEKILEEGQITSRDDVLVYEISEDAYSELANLFDKTT